MRIDVRHIDKTHVEVTLTPNWFARLFGARARRGIAIRRQHASWHRGMLHPQAWYWEATEVEVGSQIEEQIECSPVADLTDECPCDRKVSGTSYGLSSKAPRHAQCYCQGPEIPHCPFVHACQRRTPRAALPFAQARSKS